MIANLKLLFTSLLGHALFLLFFILVVRSPKPALLGDSEQKFVSSHLVAAQIIQTTPTKHLPAFLPTKNTISLSQQSTPQPTQSSTTSKGNPTSALLALLHAAIQREQQYPATAQEQEIQGRVALSFKLFPDGTISQLQIARSSGNPSLDHAALAAVHAAAPFQHVEQYLQTAQNYQLDVVFTLSD